MADTELSEKLARRRLRSRSTDDDAPVVAPKPTRIPQLEKHHETNNSPQETGRRRRSRQSGSSVSESPATTPVPSPTRNAPGYGSPTGMRLDSGPPETRRRSRLSRSSVEEDVPEMVPAKPSISRTPRTVILNTGVQEKTKAFENIVKTISKSVENYRDQKQYQRQLRNQSLEIQEHEIDSDEEDGDTFYEEEEEQEELSIHELRHHMEAFEPFGQRDLNGDDAEDSYDDEEDSYEAEDGVEIKENIEDKQHNRRIEDDPRNQRGAPMNGTGGHAPQAEPNSFVTVGSASGQQQPQQQKQQINFQQASQQNYQQQPQRQQRQQQRAQPAEPARISQNTSDDYYEPDQRQPIRMSMRAPRAGDMFHNEMKMEKRYDEEEKLGTPRRVLEWIADALQKQVPQPNGVDWKSIQLYIRDGVILCKLLNRLLKQAGMDPVGYRTKVNSAFIALNNLETFIAGAKRYGVPQTSFFQPSDLYEGRKGHLVAVINCLNALGCVANARGFQPAYKEPAPPKADWCKEECYD